MGWYLDNPASFSDWDAAPSTNVGSSGTAAGVPTAIVAIAGPATANAAIGSSSSREASPGGSKLVGMAPLTVSPPAHRRALTTSQPSPHPVPSMVRLPARWARQDAT